MGIFCRYIINVIIDKIIVWIVNSHFSQICNIVMALHIFIVHMVM